MLELLRVGATRETAGDAMFRVEEKGGWHSRNRVVRADLTARVEDAREREADLGLNVLSAALGVHEVDAEHLRLRVVVGKLLQRRQLLLARRPHQEAQKFTTTGVPGELRKRERVTGYDVPNPSIGGASIRRSGAATGSPPPAPHAVRASMPTRAVAMTARDACVLCHWPSGCTAFATNALEHRVCDRRCGLGLNSP